MDIVTRKNEENRKLSQSNLNRIDDKSSELQKFYDGKNVFVTGGTGRMNVRDNRPFNYNFRSQFVIRFYGKDAN